MRKTWIKVSPEAKRQIQNLTSIYHIAEEEISDRIVEAFIKTHRQEIEENIRKKYRGMI